MADHELDCKDYNEGKNSITWESCTLRTWLNETFYNTAFNNSEQGAIMQQMIVNDNNPEYGTGGGNNTYDNVYLLSIAEVTNPEYGFCESARAYSTDRRMQTSDYAHAMGAYEGNSCWWLRSPGRLTDVAACVKGGYVSRIGDYVDIYGSYNACVPALHIDLSSDLWSIADDENSGENSDPETVLAKEKEQSKQVLDTYKNAADYREAQKKELFDAIEAGKAAIEAAEDEAGVNSALASAKAEIDKIKTNAQMTEDERLIAAALTKVKEDSKKALESYKNASDYREAQQEELSKTIAAGKAAIDVAADEVGVSSALASAKAEIDKIKTNAQMTLEEKNSDGGARGNSNTGKITEPKNTSIQGKVKAKSKAFLVKWKKQVGITGYQIQYSINKKFKKKGTKLKTVKKSSAVKLTVKKLKPEKKYFVRIRTYKTTGCTTLYSGWSRAKTVKTKK